MKAYDTLYHHELTVVGVDRPREGWYKVELNTGVSLDVPDVAELSNLQAGDTLHILSRSSAFGWGTQWLYVSRNQRRAFVGPTFG